MSVEGSGRDGAERLIPGSRLKNNKS